VFSRRNEKAALDAILARARGGDLDARAQAQTAYRLFLHREAYLSICVGAQERASVGDLPAIDVEDMSIEEQAGAILEAEMAHDLALLRHHYEAVHRES
jgi:hypothetical protein